LQKESIKATFNHEEGTLEAETKDDVVFAINLFSSTGKIVVEAQRLGGCGFFFYETAKLVLRASKGMRKCKGLQKRFPLPSCLPKVSEEEEKRNLREGLEIASNLLKSKCVDSQLMAIQSLESLSKCTKCEAFVADSLLLDSWLATFVNLIEVGRVEDDLVGEIEDRHCLAMRRHSMCIIYNCIEALQSTGKLKAIMEDKKFCLFSHSFLSSLVEVLRCCGDRPHDACEAAKCLRQLACACPEARRAFVECDVLNAAVTAHETGVSCHAILQEESHRLRTELSQE